MAKRPRWLGAPAEKDYAAAESYLSLLLAPERLAPALAALRAAPSGSWRAKDILRAAGLPLLKAKQSSEVAAKLKDVAAGKPISPILLIHGGDGGAVVIADGYHRACAACILDEDREVPAHLALSGAVPTSSP